ncbi:MAG: methyltransferase domain-containing protein, partial [Myxococcaceae bacterium]
MQTAFRQLGQSELLPRYIFAESLFVRRRVLELGAVASTAGQSAHFLSTRGARFVLACDPDLKAVEDAQAKYGSESLRFRANVFDDLEPNSFDLVIVADLGRFVGAPELFKELVRLVARNGYLMGGLRNPAGLALSQLADPDVSDVTPTYGQLLDLLSPHFASVEVATQSPVLGYQIAFEQGEGLQVDGSLAGASEAAYFIVLAGNEPVRSFDPTWVQLPPEPLAYSGGKLEAYAKRSRDWEERSGRLKEALGKVREELTAKEARAAELAAQLEQVREESSRLVAQLDSARTHSSVATDRDELAARVRRAEAEAQVAAERAEDAERRLATQRQEAEKAQREKKDSYAQALASNEAVRLERAKKEELQSLLEDSRLRLTKAYAELRDSNDGLANARIELERLKLSAERGEEAVGRRVGELTQLRERELRLAEQLSTAMAALENLQAERNKAQTAAQSAGDQLVLKDAELARVRRETEADVQRRADAERALNAERLEHDKALDAERAERLTVETELASARAASARLSKDSETLAQSERTARGLAEQLEQKLAELKVGSKDSSSRIQDLEAELEVARSRARRLESDLVTAVSAERSSREQSEAASRALRDELASESQSHQTVREQLEQISLQAAQRMARVQSLEADLAAQEQKLSALEGDSGPTLTETRAALEAEQERGRALSEERERLAQESKALEQTVKELKSSFASLRAEHQALETTRQDLTDELVAERSALQAERARANGLQDQVVALDAERVRAKAAHEDALAEQTQVLAAERAQWDAQRQ